MKSSSISKYLILILLFTFPTSAQEESLILEQIPDLQQMAAALGMLLILIMGVRWIIADSAQERSEAKKGIMYVVVGLLIIYSVNRIICGLYCVNLPNPARGGCMEDMNCLLSIFVQLI